MEVKQRDMLDVVRQSTESFAAGTISEKLLRDLEGRDIIFLGEIHYLQEQWLFLSDLIEALYPRGFRFFAFEGPSALSWMIDDYVTGRMSSLADESLKRMCPIFDVVRAYNSKFEPQDMIHVGFCDVSFINCFLKSLGGAIKIIGSEQLSQISSSLLSVEPSEIDNVATLSIFRKSLEGIQGSLEPLWFERLISLVDYEIKRVSLLKPCTMETRESLIYDRCRDLLKQAPQGKILFNMGMVHAKKSNMLGRLLDNNVCRMFIAAPDLDSSRIFSLAAVPINVSTAYNELLAKLINLFTVKKCQNLESDKKSCEEDSATQEDVSTLMAKMFHDGLCYLHLGADEFNRRLLFFRPPLAANDEEKWFLGRDYDGLVFFSNGSLLSALKEPSFKKQFESSIDRNGYMVENIVDLFLADQCNDALDYMHEIPGESIKQMHATRNGPEDIVGTSESSGYSIANQILSRFHCQHSIKRLGLNEYMLRNAQRAAVRISRENRFLGGCWAKIFFGAKVPHVHIHDLWIDDSLHGLSHPSCAQGYQAYCLQLVEKKAKEAGCAYACLESLDFSKDFYLSHGYEPFAIDEQCVQKSDGIFLKKYFLEKKLV